MVPWACGIDGCDAVFEDVESAVLHQTRDHERHECQVCGTIVPDGYFAIRHAFDLGGGPPPRGDQTRYRG